MKYKVFIALLFTVLLAACSSSDEPIQYDETMSQTYGINDVEKVFGIHSALIVNGEDNNTESGKELVVGVRQGKFWVGCFEKNSKNLIKEWYGEKIEYSKYGGIDREKCYDLGDNKYIFYHHFSSFYVEDSPKIKEILNQKCSVEFVDQDYIYVNKGSDNYPEYYAVLTKSGDVIFENGEVCCYDGFLHGAYILEDEHIKLCLRKKNHHKFLYRRVNFNRNMTIDKGYGEKEDIYVTSVEIKLLENASWFSRYRVSFNNLDGPYYFYYANEEYFKEWKGYDSANVREWYNGTVLFYHSGKNAVYNKDFKEITRFDSKGDFESYDEIYYPSYEDALMINDYTLKLYKSGKEQRITKLDDFANNKPKYTYTVLNQEKGSMTFHVKVVNYDGSKMEFDFKVDLETLEITYL